MATHWNQALVRIASAKDPTALPTDDRVLFYDDLTITIYDKFAKAQYHFLVLPRIPFRPRLSASASTAQQGAPTLSASNGRLNFGATSSNNVPASHMKSISSILASPYAGQVLEALRTASERVVQHIRDDMMQNYGVTWDVERAFHSVPSMEHLHLHVVSMDLVSDRLKHKKHYLSFHPSAGFALRLDKAQNMVREGKKTLPKSESAYERLLKGPLESHHTCQVFRFFPELKAHLDMHWRQKILLTEAQPEGVQDTAKAHGKRDASDLAGGAASASGKGTAQRPLQSRKVELANTAAEDSTDSDDEEVSLPTR